MAIFSAAGLEDADIKIPFNEFMVEVRDIEHRNPAFQLVKNLLRGIT